MESSEAIGDSLREKALTTGITRLECGGCDESAHVTEPHVIAQLVEHAVFDHAHRQPIFGRTTVLLIDDYELALRRGAPAQTENEQTWREEQSRERDHAVA